MTILLIFAYIFLILIGALLLYMTFKTDDRRYIYLAVGFYVIFPVIVTLKLPIMLSPEVKQLYDAVEALPDSSTVMLTFDYYPSTLAETEPMSHAALHHLFRKNCKVVTMTTIPLGGPSIAERVTRELAEEYNKVYGIDFVNLGYKANYVAVLKGMGTSIETIYPTDNSGTPLSEIPMMKDIENYGDIDFIFVVADNSIVDYWISIVNAQYNNPVGTGLTAVMAPRYFAYIGSGQMTGMLGGMKGAAEYETLLQKPAAANMGMTSQSLVHLFIIFSVIAGNIIFFMGKKGKSRKSA
ncbi:MAG: hypothetical protein JSU85_06965 [Candidatus Zixiibacteriota bacterium]|nr:MAG: hypothetical protein JSU85_06965 [candidate division Zixibacteria bacterium]